MKHCTRNCLNFETRLKDKEWMKQNPGYIGICTKYRKKVNDALCGCEEKSGKITLWNFK